MITGNATRIAMNLIVNFNFSIFLIFSCYKYDDTKIRQVTPQKKVNGNELNGSWDELKWEATNEIDRLTPRAFTGIAFKRGKAEG
jgi:hypothetical protein